MAVSPELRSAARDELERTDAIDTDDVLVERLAVYSTQYSTVAHC